MGVEDEGVGEVGIELEGSAKGLIGRLPVPVPNRRQMRPHQMGIG